MQTIINHLCVCVCVWLPPPYLLILQPGMSPVPKIDSCCGPPVSVLGLALVFLSILLHEQVNYKNILAKISVWS